MAIEGKADRSANDADVLRKKETAETSARQVGDCERDCGDWHYMFATEPAVKAAASWVALKVMTDPE